MPEFWSSLADGGLPQQLRQLGDVGGDAPRLVAGRRLTRYTSLISRKNSGSLTWP